MSDEDICPTTFLVDDTSKLAGVVVPRCFRLAGETLNSAKCRVLGDYSQTREEWGEIYNAALGWRLYA